MHFKSDDSRNQGNGPGSGPNFNPNPEPRHNGPLPEGQRLELQQLPPEILAQLAQQIDQAGLGKPEQPELFQFVRDINQSIDFKETIFNIANEARRVAGVGRVSVVRYHRGKHRIECISGQPSVNRRSNEVRLLTKLADKTLRTGQPFAYPAIDILDSDDPNNSESSIDPEIPEGFPVPGELHLESDGTREIESQETEPDEVDRNDGLPPEIKNPLREYLGKGKARSVLIVPILEQETDVKRQIEDPSKVKKKKKRVLGGLIFEEFEQQRAFDLESPLLHQLCHHSADAFRRAFQHQQLFLYPVWRTVGKTKTIAFSRRLPLTVLICIALIGVLIAGLWPVDFYVSCKGVIRPVNRFRVYAEEEGRIVSTNAETGKEVKKGDILINMHSAELDARIQRNKGEIGFTESNIRYKTQSVAAGKDRDFAAGTDAPIGALREKLIGLKQEQQILESRKEKLTIRAPKDGVVLTWQNEEELAGRPTPKGRLLFEIGELDGTWELELNLPDKRIGHFLESAKKNPNPLKVDFVLGSDPNVRYQGQVDKIGNRTQIVQEEGQVLKITASLDNNKIKVLRAQAEVTAKIYCGRSTQGYLWMHDIWEVAQKRVFFYLW